MEKTTHIKTLTTAIEITLYLLVIGIMLLFGYAGQDKAVNLAKFQDGLKNSPFVPSWASWPTAIAITITFFAVDLLLLIGFWKDRFMTIGLRAAMGLTLLFTLYVTAIITAAPYKPCICIGLDERLGLGWGAHLLVNGAVLALLWATTLLNYTNKMILVATCEAPSRPLKKGNA